jgi:hypothetical protein
MSTQINWLVKGYPYSLHTRNPAATDNGFIASHIWINITAETAFILLGVTGGSASWSSRAPDYILNLDTEYQINVIEQTASGSQTTGGGAIEEYHVQGTDQYLDRGGGYEVSVVEARNAADTAQNGEIMLTPKAVAVSNAEGTMFFSSDDDHVYVATEL